MQCEIKEEAGYSVILLSGEIDLSTSPQARKAILERLGAGQAVCVDMSGVSYIDSSGVASLVEGYQTARTRKLGFCLVGVSEAAMSVLELARLDKIFPIYKTAAECPGNGG